MLKRFQKKIVILSYSFGSTTVIEAPAVYDCGSEKGPFVKLVDAKTKMSNNYQPERGYCQFLDEEYASDAPHSMYACYARDWTIKRLTGAYKFLIDRHNVDALVIIDGGTDSMVRGHEDGTLGDPLEDAVSLGAASQMSGLKCKLLISVGFGADRFNGVSDEVSLAALAELTKLGAFRGSTIF